MSTHRKTLIKLVKIEDEAENAAPVKGSFRLEAVWKLAEYIERKLVEEPTNVAYI